MRNKNYLPRGGNTIKKYFAILAISLVLFILLCSCSAKSKNTDILLYSKGLELIQKMDIMAESKEYVTIMSASPELEETIKIIGEGNYSEPKAVYKITIPKGTEASLYMGDNVAKVPKVLEEEIERRSIASIPSRINAFSGVKSVAATSLVTLGDSFINDVLKDNVIYVYLYEGEYSAIVSFLPGSENIVNATAAFVINDTLKQITSDSEMFEWVAEYISIPDCEVEEVK